MALSNYPPGTSESDPRAPWNQPEAVTYDGDLVDFIGEANETDGEVIGCVIDERPAHPLTVSTTFRDQFWVEEATYEVESGPYTTREDAARAILRWYPTEVQEAADAAEEEARAEARFDGPDEGRY